MSDQSNNDVPTLERLPHGRRRLAQLLLTRGTDAGRRFEIEGTLIVGRSPELGVSIDDVGVSRAHAAITLNDEGQFQIEDLQSRNGCYVNEVRVHKRTLRSGDRIRLGPGVELEFKEFDALDAELRERHRYEVVGRLSACLNSELSDTLGALRGRLLGQGERTAQGASNAGMQDLGTCAVRALAFTHWQKILCTGRQARETFNLSELAHLSGPWLQSWLGERIRVEVQADSAVFIHGYQSDILIALLDLCVDCAAAMPQGGALSIRVAASAGDLDLGATLAVAHSGAAACATAAAPNTGRITQLHAADIALAFVREVACLHGAEIRVDAELPKTVVTALCFPDTLPAEFRQANTVEAVVAPAARRDRRLLLVQADAVVRRVTARLLRHAGYDVAEFGAAREAIEHKAALPPTLAIVDAQLPDMSGATLLSRMTAQHAGVRGLLLEERPSARRSASELPPPPYALVHKPFTFDELVQAIEHSLS